MIYYDIFCITLYHTLQIIGIIAMIVQVFLCHDIKDGKWIEND